MKKFLMPGLISMMMVVSSVPFALKNISAASAPLNDYTIIENNVISAFTLDGKSVMFILAICASCCALAISYILCRDKNTKNANKKIRI